MKGMTENEIEKYNLFLRFQKAFLCNGYDYLHDENFSWADLEYVPEEIHDQSPEQIQATW